MNSYCLLLAGTDGKEAQVDHLIGEFSSDNSRVLAGKPKLFLFQACRGGTFLYHINEIILRSLRFFTVCVYELSPFDLAPIFKYDKKETTNDTIELCLNDFY